MTYVATYDQNAPERRHLRLAPQPEPEARHSSARRAMTWHERLDERARRRTGVNSLPPWFPDAAA
jgi:hypothetical protein